MVRSHVFSAAGRQGFGFLIPAGLAFIAFPVMVLFAATPEFALFDSIENYTSIHTVMEAFSFAVCALIFGSGWYSAGDDRSGMMALLSAAFLAVGLLDLGHVLTFGGMPRFFGPSTGDKTIFFWLAARYVGAIALLAIALSRKHWRISEPQRFAFLLSALVLVVAAYWLVVVRPDLLPPLYIEGHGLTSTKIWAEYLVVALHVATAALLALRGRRVAFFSVAPLLAAAIVLAASEMAFTLYRTGFDNYNVIGHIYKVIGFALIYRAVFVDAVTEPYRRRTESERRYRRLSDSAPDGIFTLAQDGAILSANPSAERMTGCGQSKLLGRQLASLMTPRHASAFSNWLAAARIGDADPILVDLATGDGKTTNAEISVRWLDDEHYLAIARDVTERLRSEAELRLSREHLALAQHIGHIGSIEVEIGSQMLRWSDEMFEILGLDPATAAPSFETHLAATFPDDRAKLIEARDRDHSGMGTEPVELRIIRPNGELRWLLRKSKRVAGDRQILVATFEDITDRKRIAIALEESEQLLREVTGAAGIGVYVHDHITDTIYWSSEQRANYGLDANETVTLELFSSLIHPEDRQRVAAAVQRAHDPSGDGRFDIENRIVRRDGTVRWLKTRGNTQFDGVGSDRRPKRSYGAVIDITEAKQTEEALRLSQNHLARAQAIGNIGSAELDLVRHQMRWSDEYFRLVGLPPGSEPLGSEKFRSMVMPEDRDKLLSYQELADHAGPIAPIEFRIRRPDGEVRWLHRLAEISRDVDGRPILITFTVQDITDAKLAEERRVELERRLAQSQKMEAVGQLTGGVAHDFNNLLAVILGRLQMLDEELAGTPKLQDWARSCIRAAERGASLTRSLLAFSRMQTLNPSSIDLNTIVNDMTELFRGTLGEAVEIRLVAAKQLWRCDADPGQVQNALLNLALNARDAMPSGGTLIIETSNVQIDPDYAARNGELLAGDYVVLSVSDTGVGMPPEIARRAFEPFYTTKGVGKGSGLGLSMVYGFAKQSGGHVTIYSEAGHGTTVKLYLPRTKGLAEAVAEPARSTPQGLETILVVEDNDELRDLTQMQLERLGYRVISASDGAKALELLRKHPETALLLSDVVLAGGISGPQMADRAIAKRPGLAVLFMTGYSSLTAGESVARFGTDCVLPKPFHRDHLARYIRRALDGTAVAT